MKKLVTFFTCILMLSSCGKDRKDNIKQGSEKSSAEIISGTFTGTAKVYPDQVSLGSFKGCVIPPGWEAYFVTGRGRVLITKLTDSTISLSLLGGPLPTLTYKGIKVEKQMNQILFYPGYYDITSKSLFISLSTANSIFTGSPACLKGMPYYSGWDVQLNGTYSYTTHGRADFEGVKQ